MIKDWMLPDVSGKSYLCYSSYSGFNNSYRILSKE